MKFILNNSEIIPGILIPLLAWAMFGPRITLYAMGIYIAVWAVIRAIKWLYYRFIAKPIRPTNDFRRFFQ